MRSLLVANLVARHPTEAALAVVVVAIVWLLLRLARRRHSAAPIAPSPTSPAPPPLPLTRDQQAWLAIGVPTQPFQRVHDRTFS